MKQSEIEQLLPEVFQRTIKPGTPLSAVLDVMDNLHAPVEAVLSKVDTFFNPYKTPDRFIPLLARWVDLDRLFEQSVESIHRQVEQEPISTGMGRLRELVATSAHLARLRGTKRGLLLFLETATGMKGFVLNERVTGKAGQHLAFHLKVYAPEALRLHRALLERILESQKPAYVTYELAFVASESGGS